MPKKLVFLLLLLPLAVLPSSAEPNVTRATLKNGLQIIIVRNPLAPAVTVYDNYRVGGDETPAGFPGMAHAQEHMMFRGCDGLTADQTAAIFAQLGGDNNADTQQNITQYFETVPAHDLDIALHADSDCMKGASDLAAQWTEERPAIEQEVARDLSDPMYKLITRVNHDLFAGTPYEHDPLGTKSSFDATTAAMLKEFHEKWYAPNNATLVIAGDVEPQATIATIKKLYGAIPSRALPPRPKIDLRPVKPETFTLPSDYPYIVGIIAFRMPGSDSPDYAAATVLADVLSSQRGPIYQLVADGKALAAGFQTEETYRKAAMGMAYVVLPTNADVSAMDKTISTLLAQDATHGVSPDLVAAAKRSEIASAEFNRNSIPGLANLWSQAVVSEGRTSPQQDVDAIAKVTVADVNRVAKQYLVEQNAIVGTLQPQPSGGPVAGKGFGGGEKVTSAPTKPVPLPPWAEKQLGTLAIPKWNLNPSDTVLPNGIRLIVQTDTTTPTVTVMGRIRHRAELETPAGQDGVDDVLGGLFSYGTTTLNRIAFQKALDDIGANESAGPDFSLQVLKKYFDRGLFLLADNELHPALPAPAFKIVQMQTSQAVADLLKSPQYRAELARTKGLVPPSDPSLRQATPQTVDSLNLNDIHSYYGKVFRPDLTTIVIIGDITPAEARAAIEKDFGDWQATGPKPQVDLPPVPRNRPAASDVPDPTRIQDSVSLSEELPMNRFDPDYYALELGNHVLGGGFYATRLYRDLREKTGYVYFISNALSAQKTRTIFSVTYGALPTNITKANVLILRDLRDMQTTDVAQGELQQAKALVLRQIPLAEASESSVAGGLLNRAVIGLPLDEPELAARRYFSLTADQVRAAFAKFIRPDDFVQVSLGPPPQ
ncbi:MAG: M16 family metallopeptidase [Acidobacteriaceae bacterium]